MYERRNIKVKIYITSILTIMIYIKVMLSGINYYIPMLFNLQYANTINYNFIKIMAVELYMKLSIYTWNTYEYLNI